MIYKISMIAFLGLTALELFGVFTMPILIAIAATVATIALIADK